MGKVFSAFEVMNGATPKLLSYSKLKNEIVQLVTESDVLIGGLICGSVLRGDHNVRSDLDFVTVYSHENSGVAAYGLSKIIQLAESLFVPLEVIHADTEVASSSGHSIGPAFRKHLDWAAEHGGVIKNNPLVHFQPIPISLEHDIADYFRQKLSKLSKGRVRFACMSFEEQLEYLQKIIEAPERTMRKWLEYHGFDVGGCGKLEAVEHYANHPKCPGFKIGPDLYALDVEYTGEVQRQLDGARNKARYTRAIDVITNSIPRVIEFVRTNALSLE